MSKIFFIYRENEYEMILEDRNLNIFYQYSKTIDANINDLLFLYNGKKISLNDFQIIINMLKSNKNIIISVYNLNINKKNDNIYENLICPSCKNLTFLNFNDNNINNCKNMKECSYEYKSITEFMSNQIIEEKEIKCSLCNNNKFLYGNNFFICSCKNKICQLCINKHENNNNHNLIYYNRRYLICNKHLIEYISYCSICNLNLCERCEKEHENHKIIIYKKEIPNEKRINEINKEIKLIISNIEQYKIEINHLKDLLYYFIINLNEDIDNYIKLYNKILLLLNNLKNYQNIKNILNYKNINLNKDINNFLNENLKNKIKYLMNKFNENIFETSLIYNMNY